MKINSPQCFANKIRSSAYLTFVKFRRFQDQDHTTTVLQTEFPFTHVPDLNKQQCANHITLIHTTINGECFPIRGAPSCQAGIFRFLPNGILLTSRDSDSGRWRAVNPGSRSGLLVQLGPVFLDVGGDMIEVVHRQETRKYVGKKPPADLRTRATVDVKHKIHIAWMKFNQHKEALLNRHLSLKLRLKFFDSIISLPLCLVSKHSLC